MEKLVNFNGITGFAQAGEVTDLHLLIIHLLNKPYQPVFWLLMLASATNYVPDELACYRLFCEDVGVKFTMMKEDGQGRD